MLDSFRMIALSLVDFRLHEIQYEIRSPAEWETLKRLKYSESLTDDKANKTSFKVEFIMGNMKILFLVK